MHEGSCRNRGRVVGWEGYAAASLTRVGCTSTMLGMLMVDEHHALTPARHGIIIIYIILYICTLLLLYNAYGRRAPRLDACTAQWLSTMQRARCNTQQTAHDMQQTYTAAQHSTQRATVAPATTCRCHATVGHKMQRCNDATSHPITRRATVAESRPHRAVS